MSIKSKYIYDIIFSYINDENFKYKFFKYSKENQSKISINLTDCKNIYYNSLDFNLDDYLLYKYNNSETNFDIKYLTKKLNEDLIKFDIDIKDFESAVDYYLKNNQTKEYYIDIFSPLFDFLSQKNYFEKIFSINIILFNEDNLNQEYITTFKKLNETNIKYSSLTLNIEQNKSLINPIDLFNSFNINFKNIKKLIIKEHKSQENKEDNEDIKDNEENSENEDNEENSENEDNEDNEDHEENSENEENSEKNNSIENLLFILDLFDDLIYLEIECNNRKLNSNEIDKINKLKNLEILKLTGVNFDKNSNLELCDLEELELKSSTINISKNNYPKLKKLKLKDLSLNMKEKSFSFPQLETCIVKDLNSENFIDFKNLKKLKHFESTNENFLMLGDVQLENLGILLDEEEEASKVKKIMDKIISIKTLKNFDFHFISQNISNYDFTKIKNKNNSLMDIDFHIEGCFEHNNILISFFNTFPNIKNIYIETTNTLEYITQSDYRIIQSVISHAVNPETYWRISTIKDIVMSMKKKIEKKESEKILLDYSNEYLEILEKFIKEKSNDDLREQLLEKIIDIEKLEIDNEQKYNLNITEHKNCKFEKIKLLYVGNNYNINWPFFGNIKELNLEIWTPLTNVDIFPFFKNNNNFKSLKHFKFEYFMEKINLDLIKNLYNNLNNMPKLKNIILFCDVDGIQYDFYEIFIKKLFEMNLIEINIKLKKEYKGFYTLDELKKLNNNLRIRNPYKIKIRKI